MAEASLIDTILQDLKDLLVPEPPADSLQEWQGGPESNWRCKDVAVDEYIDCLRALEAGPAGAEGLPAMVQRLRRLYFSVYTFTEHAPCGNSASTRQPKFVSAMLDVLTTPVTNYAAPPLTTAHLPQAQLDRLFETSAVVTTLGSKIGMSHLWAVADLAINGSDPATTGASGLVPRTSVAALATWLGDLASAVLGYEQDLRKNLVANNQNTRQNRIQLIAGWASGKAGKGDLLGDFDGIAIGNHIARHNPNAFTLSAFLQDYYDNEALSNDLASQLGRPSAAYRFHYFLKYADPALPASGLDSDPFVAVFDKLGASNAMPGLLAAACEDMMLVYRARELSKDPVKFLFDGSFAAARLPLEQRLDKYDGRDAFHWLCDDFCRFVDQGVSAGDAVWPSNP
ncbi:MAG TPA: hypothetical protein VN893_25450 [Bryobacteraceae bacterium]|nr:hypothetical protein [Bryobacteraceae bacterium]